MSVAPPPDAERLLSAMTEEERAKLAQILGGGPTITLADFKIRDENRRLIPFTPNHVQRLYWRQLFGREYDGIPVRFTHKREIILKARKEGISTLWCLMYLWDCLTTPLTETVLVAHERTAAEKIFQIVQTAYKSLPNEKRPRTGTASKREFYWPSLESRFTIATAGSEDVGRGGTPNNLHLSEAASYSDMDAIITGLVNSVPASGNIVWETTAKGIGNRFYEEWQRAKNGSALPGEDPYTPRFFAWFDDPKYANNDPILLEKYRPTEEEAKLQALYNLSAAQMLWRRGKKAQQKELFVQEYPANDREAFVSSGTGFFHQEYLSSLYDQLTKRSRVKAEQRSDNGFDWRGTVRIYEYPERGVEYVIGGDVAEGISDEKRDHDWFALSIHRSDNWKQVATYFAREGCDTGTFALDCYNLSTWYNNAILCIERNNMGHAVLMRLEDYEANLYYHRVSRVQYGQPIEEMVAGWPATERTKAIRDARLKGLIQERADGLPGLEISDERTASELLTYVNLTSRKRGGEGKSHDDAVTALGCATEALFEFYEQPNQNRNAARYAPPQRERRGLWNRK